MRSPSDPIRTAHTQVEAPFMLGTSGSGVVWVDHEQQDSGSHSHSAHARAVNWVYLNT